MSTFQLKEKNIHKIQETGLLCFLLGYKTQHYQQGKEAHSTWQCVVLWLLRRERRREELINRSGWTQQKSDGTQHSLEKEVWWQELKRTAKIDKNGYRTITRSSHCLTKEFKVECTVPFLFILTTSWIAVVWVTVTDLRSPERGFELNLPDPSLRF